LPTQAERRRGQRPKAVRNARSKRERRALTPPSTASKSKRDGRVICSNQEESSDGRLTMTSPRHRRRQSVANRDESRADCRVHLRRDPEPIVRVIDSFDHAAGVMTMQARRRGVSDPSGRPWGGRHFRTGGSLTPPAAHLRQCRRRQRPPPNATSRSVAALVTRTPQRADTGTVPAKSVANTSAGEPVSTM
jgi:hypothetical protein